MKNPDALWDRGIAEAAAPARRVAARRRRRRPCRSSPLKTRRALADGGGKDDPGGPFVTIDIQSAGLTQALTRVREITAPLQAPPPVPGVAPATDFAGKLSAAMESGAQPGQSAMGYREAALGLGSLAPVGTVAPTAVATAGTRGQQIAAIATAELGVAEEPAGSNDGARIAHYRTATAGSGVGPWCAYFTSWVAGQAGVPVGPDGSGLGYVPTVKQWAEQTGRYIPAGAGAPQVGDLVVFDRASNGVLDHIGVVTGVSADGGIQTVEGNSSDQVSARSYGADGYAGLVRLVPPGT